MRVMRVGRRAEASREECVRPRRRTGKDRSASAEQVKWTENLPWRYLELESNVAKDLSLCLRAQSDTSALRQRQTGLPKGIVALLHLHLRFRADMQAALRIALHLLDPLGRRWSLMPPGSSERKEACSVRVSSLFSSLVEAAGYSPSPAMLAAPRPKPVFACLRACTRA
jgi:hypothetical protein